MEEICHDAFSLVFKLCFNKMLVVDYGFLNKGRVLYSAVCNGHLSTKRAFRWFHTMKRLYKSVKTDFVVNYHNFQRLHTYLPYELLEINNCMTFWHLVHTTYYSYALLNCSFSGGVAIAFSLLSSTAYNEGDIEGARAKGKISLAISVAGITITVVALLSISIYLIVVLTS